MENLMVFNMKRVLNSFKSLGTAKIQKVWKKKVPRNTSEIWLKQDIDFMNEAPLLRNPAGRVATIWPQSEGAPKCYWRQSPPSKSQDWD